MDDSHPDPYTFRSDPAVLRRAQASLERPSRLVQALREARRNSGLGLDDLAEITHIRFFYLEALEAGRLAELPGDAEGKNLVRRYAQAVGLDPARALILYAQERRNLTPQTEIVRLELPDDPDYTAAPHPRLGRFTRLFGSLLLVAGAIWLALRVFDTTLVPATTAAGTLQTPRAGAEPTFTPVGSARTTPATTPPTSTMILLSLQTTPPGAEISIDGYRFGQSPVLDAPVRAGNRTLKVSRGGYGTFERTLDLNRDSRLNVTLFPKGAGEPTITGVAPTAAQVERPSSVPTSTGVASVATASAQLAPVTAQVVVTVSAEAWLEVYRGTTRGGERLVYETAEPGDTYSFGAPIYVFSGNAGGVSVAKGEASPKPLGVSGAVVGQAY